MKKTTVANFTLVVFIVLGGNAGLLKADNKSQPKPKRVTFAAGKSEAIEIISLKAGGSKRYVVRAQTGQIFMASSDSKNLEITMVSGKDTAQMKEAGHYDSTLLANGDYVFQVKNISEAEVKSSVRIIIDHTSASKR